MSRPRGGLHSRRVHSTRAPLLTAPAKNGNSFHSPTRSRRPRALRIGEDITNLEPGANIPGASVLC